MYLAFIRQYGASCYGVLSFELCMCGALCYGVGHLVTSLFVPNVIRRSVSSFAHRHGYGNKLVSVDFFCVCVYV